MPTAVVFDEAINNIGAGVINLSTDTVKVALTNAAPDQAAWDELADVTQISATGGYALQTVTTSWAETGSGTGVWRSRRQAPPWTPIATRFGIQTPAPATSSLLMSIEGQRAQFLTARRERSPFRLGCSRSRCRNEAARYAGARRPLSHCLSWANHGWE
jgi:hypothetical protein